MAGSYGSSIFNFSRKNYTVYYSSKAYFITTQYQITESNEKATENYKKILSDRRICDTITGICKQNLSRFAESCSFFANARASGPFKYKGRLLMKLVIAEKPSVARDIASVLGATQKRNGYNLPL